MTDIGFLGQIIHTCTKVPDKSIIYVVPNQDTCPFCREHIKMSEKIPTPEEMQLVGGYNPSKQPNYNSEQHGEQAQQRYGSPIFYELLNSMAEIHDRKSHDYASDNNPVGNYHFAGMLSKLFNSPEDSGFVGRIGEKLFRLANLENNSKTAMNESVEDTEIDICIITTLWMSDRKARRQKNRLSQNDSPFYNIMESLQSCPFCTTDKMELDKLKGHLRTMHSLGVTK